MNRNLRFIFRNLLMLIVVMCNVGCDQITKSIVRQRIDYNESFNIISNHITLTKVENAGAFLSLGESFPWPVKVILLSIIPVAVLLVGIYMLLTKTGLSKMFVAGLSFIIGGGIGNVYDRILYGSVTDFLHIDFGLFQTGIFNMADVSITIGAILVFIELQINKRQLSSHEPTS